MIKNLIMCLMFIAIFFIIACSPEENDSPPIYQPAVYTINVDGSNNQRVIDVDSYDTVQFIPNSNKLLYYSGNQLFTVSEDGLDNTLISDNIEVMRTTLGYTKPSISIDGSFVIFTGMINGQLDIFHYDTTIYSLENLTNTSEIDEYNPKFAYDENIACYISHQDSLYYLLSADFLDSMIDTIYTTTRQITSCSYSTDNEEIFFFEEYDDLKISGRDYFRTYLKVINLLDSDISIISDHSANYGSYTFDFNDQKLVCYNYFYSTWDVFSLIDYSAIQFSDFEINYLDIDNNNRIYYSAGLSVDSAEIKIFDIDTQSPVEFLNNAISPSLDYLGERLCYFGRYNINVKRDLLLN